jgi:hypothetical protein
MRKFSKKSSTEKDIKYAKHQLEIISEMIQMYKDRKEHPIFNNEQIRKLKKQQLFFENKLTF